MNAKINKEFTSSHYINKVMFWLTLIAILAAFIFHFFILKNDFFIINFPHLIAAYLSDNKFLTGGNIFKYFSYSVPFIFSIIFLYFIIPFNLIFSISPALSIIKEKETVKRFFKYEIFNFFLSTFTLFIMLISLVYVNYLYVPEKSQATLLNAKLREAEEINIVNDLALELRNMNSVPKKNKGWYGMTSNEFDIYKQYHANYITNFLNSPNPDNIIISKAIPTLVEFYKLNFKLYVKDGPIYLLKITPQSHDISKPE